jgi:hypothetical protein
MLWNVVVILSVTFFRLYNVLTAQHLRPQAAACLALPCPALSRVC